MVVLQRLRIHDPALLVANVCPYVRAYTIPLHQHWGIREPWHGNRQTNGRSAERQGWSRADCRPGDIALWAVMLADLEFCQVLRAAHLFRNHEWFGMRDFLRGRFVWVVTACDR